MNFDRRQFCKMLSAVPFLGLADGRAADKEPLKTDAKESVGPEISGPVTDGRRADVGIMKNPLYIDGELAGEVISYGDGAGEWPRMFLSDELPLFTREGAWNVPNVNIGKIEIFYIGISSYMTNVIHGGIIDFLIKFKDAGEFVFSGTCIEFETCGVDNLQRIVVVPGKIPAFV